MSRYLMNAAVIPHGCPGTFTYRLATVEELIAFVQAGEVINSIAYQESLNWIAALTGVTFTVSRAIYPLQPGDEAFVIRRTTRLTKTWQPREPLDPSLIELGVLRCEGPPPAKPPPVHKEQRPVMRQARARRKG
jgi:hypothetical protein